MICTKLWPPRERGAGVFVKDDASKAIMADWTETNRRRCELIRKDVKSGLSVTETAELSKLEALADARIALMDLHNPVNPSEIEMTMERLKMEGKWIE